MKQATALLLVILFAAAFVGWRLYTGLVSQNEDLLRPIPAGRSATAPGPTGSGNVVLFEGAPYGYDWFGVSGSERIFLIANFRERARSADIVAQNSCRKAVNAGFYTTDNTPLGMWKSGGQYLARPQQNALINGFFWSDGAGWHISRDVPPGSAENAVQTGPVLLSDGQVLPLRIQNDRGARRMVAAVTRSGSPVFIMVAGSNDSETSGPLLADLPEIIAGISARLPTPLSWAINLDGGNASAFKTADRSYPEWKPVGSLFCIR